jgi:hypothetical protein
MNASDVMRIGRRRSGTLRAPRASVLALFLFLPGELDDQHGVLRGEPDQHDEADLRDQVVVDPAEPDAEQRERQAHRRDEDDGERRSQLSYSAECTRKTNSTQSGKMKSAVLPASCAWYARSVHSIECPRAELPRALHRAMAVPRLPPGARRP